MAPRSQGQEHGQACVPPGPSNGAACTTGVLTRILHPWAGVVHSRFPSGDSDLALRSLVLMFALAAKAPCFAQEGDTLRFARSTLYASGLWNGLLYSINWDHRLRVGTTKWMSVRGCLIFYPGSDHPTNFPMLSISLQGSRFRGKNHHREHGAGHPNASGWWTGRSEDGDPVSSQGVHGVVKAVGYRFQPDQGGSFLRVNLLAWTRIAELNRRYAEADGVFLKPPPVFPWFGLDIGYTFSDRTKQL